MKGFAKIIELEKHDVLVYIDSNDDDLEHFIMTARFDDFSINAVHRFDDDKEKCIKEFNKVDKKKCQEFINNIEEMINQ